MWIIFSELFRQHVNHTFNCLLTNFPGWPLLVYACTCTWKSNVLESVPTLDIAMLVNKLELLIKKVLRASIDGILVD